MQTLYVVKTGSTFDAIARSYGDFDAWIVQGLVPNYLLRAEHPPIEVIDACDFPSKSQHYPCPDQCAGVVISGSHDMVTDQAPWMTELENWLYSVCMAGVPVLGICFGHQMLAQVLGGKVGCHPGGLEIGTVPVSVVQPDLSLDPVWRGMPPCFDAQTVHFQSVRQLPKGAAMLAGNSHDPYHAFRWRNNVWGVQFHPEFNASHMQAYIDHVSQELARNGSHLDPHHLRCSETPEAAQLLHRFSAHAHRFALQKQSWLVAA